METANEYRDWAHKLESAMSSIKDILKSKHHDYGEKNLMRRGELGIIIRIEDKLSRIENLMDKQSSVDETKYQTWLDIAGYAIQAMILGCSKDE